LKGPGSSGLVFRHAVVTLTVEPDACARPPHPFNPNPSSPTPVPSLPETFKLHLSSKKHIQKAKAARLDEAAQLESIVWAEAIKADDYSAETHAERLQRMAKVWRVGC